MIFPVPYDTTDSGDKAPPRFRPPAPAAPAAVAILPTMVIHQDVPPVEIDPTEAEIWKGLRAESDLEKVAQACEMLTAARDNGTPLSARSLDLLAIEDADSRFAYVEAVKEQPHRQDTVITCMSTMPKNSEEPDAVSSLVIGTESRLLIILDPAATTKLCQVELASVPIFICVTGTFDVDWRIVAHPQQVPVVPPAIPPQLLPP